MSIEGDKLSAHLAALKFNEEIQDAASKRGSKMRQGAESGSGGPNNAPGVDRFAFPISNAVKHALARAGTLVGRR